MVYTQYRDVVECEHCDNKAQVVYFQTRSFGNWDLKLFCRKCAKAHMRANKY